MQILASHLQPKSTVYEILRTTQRTICQRSFRHLNLGCPDEPDLAFLFVEWQTIGAPTAVCWAPLGMFLTPAATESKLEFQQGSNVVARVSHTREKKADNPWISRILIPGFPIMSHQM